MVDRDGSGYPHSAARGEILGLAEDARLRKHLPGTPSLIKNDSQGIEED